MERLQRLKTWLRKDRRWLWLGLIAVLLGGWLYLGSGGTSREADRTASQGSSSVNTQKLDYDRVAVSDGLSADALALNLAADLDPSLLPGIGREVVREAAERGLREQAFLEYLIQEVSNRVRAISTIDLNGDDVVDPLLVRPEPSQENQYLLLSLQVPEPDAYPLPAASETEAWARVGTLEVASMSISLSEEALTVQATPDPHVYPGQGGQHYVARDTTSSFLNTYLAIGMLSWMFSPGPFGFWGPGFGYAGYIPTTVQNQQVRRRQTLSQRGYQRSAPSRTSSITGRGGAAPKSQYNRAYGSTPPRSLQQLKSSASFRRRQAGKAASGGFGRPSGTTRPQATTPRSPQRSPSAQRPTRSPRRFGRGTSPRRFGGFGRRGFRFR